MGKRQPDYSSGRGPLARSRSEAFGNSMSRAGPATTSRNRKGQKVDHGENYARATWPKLSHEGNAYALSVQREGLNSHPSSTTTVSFLPSLADNSHPDSRVVEESPSSSCRASQGVRCPVANSLHRGL